MSKDHLTEKELLASNACITKGIDALRRLLLKMRDREQDGYHDVGPDGKFVGTAKFVTTSLPQTTPEDLDALFEYVGIVPDPIKSLGNCEDCAHGNAKGGSLGWGAPCVSCSSPKMKNFVPLSSLAHDLLDENELRVLINIQKGVWRSEGIVTMSMPRVGEIFQNLLTRGLLATTLHGHAVTNRGILAIKRGGK